MWGGVQSLLAASSVSKATEVVQAGGEPICCAGCWWLQGSNMLKAEGNKLHSQGGRDSCLQQFPCLQQQQPTQHSCSRCTVTSPHAPIEYIFQGVMWGLLYPCV